MYPETALDALAAWDKGDIVWTVEMGGLGPGYEQAIHVVAFEIIRDAIGPFDDAHTKPFQDRADETIRRISAIPDSNLGLSGAQAGAATWLAFRTLGKGWRATLEEAKAKDADRLTMVSRTWPRVELPVASTR